jgi:Protein similar to CwfJ C-terminus 2
MLKIYIVNILVFREAMVGPSLLDMPEKVDWKDCQVSKEVEKEYAVKFRDEFQPFDFTV